MAARCPPTAVIRGRRTTLRQSPLSTPSRLRAILCPSIPLSELSETRDRPLFSTTRRPPPAEGAVVAASKTSVEDKPPGPEVPPFVLKGTVLGSNDRVAVLFDPTTNRTSQLRLGKSDSGWTVLNVSPRSIVLRKGELLTTSGAPAAGRAHHEGRHSMNASIVLLLAKSSRSTNGERLITTLLSQSRIVFAQGLSGPCKAGMGRSRISLRQIWEASRHLSARSRG